MKLKCEFKDVVDLEKAYIQFVQGGGLYVATDSDMRLGDTVSLNVTLPEKDEDFSLSAKIVWINPKPKDISQLGGGVQLADDAKDVVWVMPDSIGKGVRAPGVGLQFIGDSAIEVRNTIQKMIG